MTGAQAAAHRRRVLIGIVGGAAAAAAAAAARISSALHDPPPTSALPVLELSAESSTMSSLSVKVDDRLLADGDAAGGRSAGLTTSVYSMVGATWTGTVDPRIRVRPRSGGSWRGWRVLPHLHDLPDRDGHEGSVLNATQLVWTGDSDGIQISVTGPRPADLVLVLLRPGRLPHDTTVPRTATNVTRSDPGPRSGLAADARTGVVPAPPLLSRADWGADESWRNGSPRYNKTLQQAHVHHTASGNDYAADDVPAIIRGFYRYHTGTLGWSDIAYNFLVDRFGRIWVGRAGGPRRPVRGAHTLGFNATSVGIAVIGNYEEATPRDEVLRSVAAVAAWKLHPYGRDPSGVVRVDSEGSDKFRAGRVVSLPVIDGHRDTNDTACPGDHVYTRLPQIRHRASVIVHRAEEPPAVTVVSPSTLTGTALVGQTLTVTLGTFKPRTATTACTWRRDGQVISTATGLSYTLGAADLGAVITAHLETTATGFDTVAEDLATAGIVRATTSVTATAHGGVRDATVHVRVQVTDTDVVATGDVTVTVRDKSRTVSLVDGTASARFTRLRPGPASAAVTYAGTAELQPSSASTTLIVRDRRRLQP